MSKTNASPRTITVPVTTMAEVPVLSEREREAFMASVHEAEAAIDAGDHLEFGPGEFQTWIRDRVDEARRKKSA